MTDDAQPQAEQTESVGQPSRPIATRRESRTAFWLGSMGRGSLILFVVTAITVSAIFIHSDVQADGFSAGRVFNDVLAALFWSGLGIVGTFYISIPAATLIVVAFRLAYRRLRHR